MQPIIEVKNVYYNIEQEAILRNISFNIDQGDFVIISGENGSGKTTLIKALLGLREVNQGTIKLFGQSIKNFTKWNKIGYLPQNLYQVLADIPITVEEFINSAKTSISILNKQEEEKLESLFNYRQYSKKLLQELSGGQMQRVFLVRSIINNPQVLILDEPTSGLDKSSRESFVKLIKKLHKTNISIIVVTHEIEIFKNLYDRVLCINQNSIISRTEFEHVHQQ